LGIKNRIARNSIFKPFFHRKLVSGLRKEAESLYPACLKMEGFFSLDKIWVEKIVLPFLEERWLWRSFRKIKQCKLPL
jgi:hypothetical protein